MKHLYRSSLAMLSFLLPLRLSIGVLILVIPCMHSFVNAQTGIGVPSFHACDSLVQAFLTKWTIPGATVALAKDGKLVYMRAFGTADQNGAEVTQPYHMFRIMSVSKPVTAIAIMKLREQGMLNLDDHIFGPGGILQSNLYIAGATISDSRIYNITVRNCLEHTAGWNKDISMTPNPLPPYPFGFSISDPKEFPLYVTATLGEPNPVTERGMVKFMLQRGLNYTPGTEFHYGNMEYCILGLVIEQLTGMSYEDYVRTAILEPLGIYDMHLGKSLLANKIEREGEYTAAFSILSSFGTGQNVPYQYGGLNQESFSAFAGWIATARDLVRLIVAVDGFNTKPDILTAASIDTMKVGSAACPTCAKGWFVDGSDTWNHNGDLGGSQCYVLRTGNGYTWAMIINRREYATYQNQLNDLLALPGQCLAAISSYPTFDLLEFPIQNAGNIAFSNNAAHSVTVNWTNGNGDGRLLLASVSTPTAKFPLDGVTYTANSAFGSGQNLGSGNYVVYSGNGNNVTINNLYPGAVYHFRLFEFNKNDTTGNYALYQLGKSERASIQTPPADSTSVVATMDTSLYGQMVTFTATVTPIAPVVGTPTGTVTFKSGATTIGSAILDSSGQASVSTSGLSVGNHPITAQYGGDGNFNPDTSGILNHTVNQSSSSTSLTSNVNPLPYGQSVTFTATIAATLPGGGTPAGMVTFKEGTVTLGTGVLNGNGKATFSTNALVVGNHSITAEYNGNTNYMASASAGFDQEVTEFHLDVQAGWNMISAPFVTGDYSRLTLFPTAISNAFVYEGQYVPVSDFTIGKGAWLKFDQPKNVTLTGSPSSIDSIHVTQGWNMLGSISTPVAISSITSIPGGIVTSPFYGYDGSAYVLSDTIFPGRAYWVKVNQAGKLILSASTVASSVTSKITIAMTPELPPPPPGHETSSDESGLKPVTFSLSQNYPNPFNPSTVIRYQIPVVSRVSLKVYDVLGQELRTLVDEMQEAGYKSVEFDAGKLPSGVYMYRLQAGTFVETRKLLFMK